MAVTANLPNRRANRPLFAGETLMYFKYLVPYSVHYIVLYAEPDRPVIYPANPSGRK